VKFFTHSAKFFGYIGFKHGIFLHHSEVDVIKSSLTPFDVTKVRSFHDLALFYR